MPLQLKTSHPLFANITAFICVDDDGIIKDLKGSQTCTPDASVTTGEGTFGRHFVTNILSNNARGVTLSPGIASKTSATPAQTSFIVVNNVDSVNGTRGSVLSAGASATDAPWSPSVSTGGLVRLTSTSGSTAAGTTNILNNGAHSFGGFVNSSSNWAAFVDGQVESSASGNVGNATDTGLGKMIGGWPSGGFGGPAAKYVYFVQFNKALTAQEISDLHASLGANNTFALLEPAAAASVSFSGTVGNQTATAGTAFNLNLSSFFAGSLTPFTYSLVAGDLTGTGLSLNTSTGVISGTPTASATLTGLQVRATDTDSNTAQTNTFSITVSAAPQVPQGTFTVGTITVTSSTASVPYTYSASDQTSIQYTLNGGTTTFTASNSPQALSGLTANTTYTIQFRAVNAAGNGAWSTGVQFTTNAATTASFTLIGLANNAGVLWSDTGSITVDVYNPSTGALVIRKTGLSSNTSGDVIVSDAAMTSATTYTAIITIGSARGVVSVTTS